METEGTGYFPRFKINYENNIIRFFLVISVISAIVTVIFLPFGLNVNGVLESYAYMRIYAFPELWAELLNIPHHIMRPVRPPMYLSAYNITPYSYFGINIINYVLIILKGVLLHYVLEKLRFPFVIALATAALFVVYPTNSTGLRLVLVVPGTTVFFLSALLCFLRLNKRWHLLDALCMAFFLTLLTLTNEITYPLILLAPLLPVFLNRGITIRIIKLSLFWYSIPAIVALRWFYYFVTLENQVYAQKTIVDNSIEALFTQLVDAYRFNLGTAWFNTSFAVYNANLLYFVLVAVVTIPLFFLFLKLHQQEIGTEHPSHLLLKMAFSLIVIFASYAVILITVVRLFYERAFGISSIGSALFIVCLISLIVSYSGKFRHILWSLAITALISLALFEGLYARERNLSVAMEQQSVVSNIVEQIPASTAEAIIVFNPGSDFLLERSVEFPLQILYDTLDLSAYVCYRGYIAELVTTCEFNEDEIILTRETGKDRFTDRFAYEDIIAFDNRGINDVHLMNDIPADYLDGIIAETYNPSALICLDCDYPARVDTYFTGFPFSYPPQMISENRLRNLIYYLRGD